MSLTLAIYTDYVCPFCYLHHAVVSALAESEALELEVDWRCVEIHPETPTEGRPLERKGRYAAKWDAWVAPFCEETGIALNFPAFLPNTREAALATALAGIDGSAPAFHAAVLTAYWQDGRDIGDPNTLADIAQETGLHALTPERWQTDACAAVVAGHRAQSYDDMATGFPTTMLGAFPLVGLQSPQDFRTHLARYRRVVEKNATAG